MKKSILLGLIITWVLHFNANAQITVIPSSQWQGWPSLTQPTPQQMRSMNGWTGTVNNGLRSPGNWEPSFHAGEFGIGGSMAVTDYVWTSTDPQFQEAWVITTFDAGNKGNCEQFLWESFADNCHTVYLNGVNRGSLPCAPPNSSVGIMLSIDLTPNVQRGVNHIAVKITNTGAATATNPRYLIGGLDIINPDLSLGITPNFSCPHTALIGTMDDSQSSLKFESYQWYFEGRPIVGATGLTHNATEGDGEYTLRGYYGDGCYKEEPEDVGVNNLRYLNDVPISLNCGGTVTLQESTGLPMESYLWNTGETTSSIVVDHGGTYTIRATNAAGCMTEQNFVVTDDCCEAEVSTSNGTEIIYDKRLFNTLYPDLKTISSVVDDGILYLLMQDDVAGPFVSGGPFNTFGFVVCMLDAETGAFLQAYDYQFDVFGTANLYDPTADVPDVFWAQEIEIISDGTSQENGIYVIGNSEYIYTEGAQATRYGRQVIQTNSGVSIKLDLDDRALIDVKYTTIPIASRLPDGVEGFNYESFSLIDEEGSMGWLIVGTAFDYENVTGHQMLWPILIKTDLLGNILNHKLVEFDLPCATCPADNENVWAIDISEPITGNDAEYAVLLQSRNDAEFRTSYLLVDKDLNIYTRGNPITWWDPAPSQLEMYPHKIMYENFGTYQLIKIVGGYSDASKGFIHEFGANTWNSYFYAANRLVDFDIPPFGQGILDFTKQGTSYYLASQHHIIELDDLLNVVNWSEQWNNQLVNTTVIRPYHFMHNLIHPCQDGGLVSTSRESGYCRKTSSDLQMKCEWGPSPITASPSQVNRIEVDYIEKFTHFEEANPEHSRLNVSFDIQCCNDLIFSVPPSRCGVEIDFDYAIDCDRVTITDIDILGDIDAGANYLWSASTVPLYGPFNSESRPVISSGGFNQVEICLEVVYTKDGSSCSKTHCETIDFLPRSISGQSHENGWQNVFTNGGNNMLGPWTISSSDEYYPIDIDGDTQEELLCTNPGGSGRASLLRYDGSVWQDVGTSFSATFLSYISDGEFIIGDFDAITGRQEIICLELGVLPRMFYLNSTNDIQIWQETIGNPVLSPYFEACNAGNFDLSNNGDELLGTDAISARLFRYINGTWSTYHTEFFHNLISVNRDDIKVGDFGGLGFDQMLINTANPILYSYNPTPPSAIEETWNHTDGPEPDWGTIRSWSMPIASNDFMLIGDIDNPDSKEEILFIEEGIDASKASTAELFLSINPDYAYWIDNWANLAAEPFIDDWPLYDISEDYTKYLLIRNDANAGKDDLLAIRKVTCGGAMYVANMYSTNSTTHSYKKSEGETTSINDPVEDENELWIYPNPTNSTFAIGTSADGQLIDHVKIISMTGQVVLEDSHVDPSKQYNLAGHESGIYVVEISVGSLTKHLKLVLNH